MKIGFEAKRLFTNYTGLGNYSRFVVDALSVHRPEHAYILFTPKATSNGEVGHIVARKNVGVVKPTGLYTGFTRLWRSWGLSRHKAAQTLDVFHGLSQELPFNLPRRTKKVVTVHDLIFLRFPEFYHSWDVAIYKAKVKSACNRADRIIAVSDQTARDIVDFLGIDASKVTVIYQGCHPNFRRETTPEKRADVRMRYGLPEEFILNVGTIERRKNIQILIDALALMPEDMRIPVVIMGRPSSYLREVVDRARQKHVYRHLRILHNVSFPDFPAIYQQASAFVYPSLFEGFGIPLVEAIESRIPVITSKGSCFIEAAGPGALYVDPRNPEELARSLEACLTDDALRERIVNDSFEYVQQFRPEKIASNMDQLYQELLVG